MLHEHWKLNEKGELKGIYTINGTKARELYGERGYWQGVDNILKDYSQIHPGEMKFQMAENTITKRENFNKFGSSKGHTFRQALALPVGLHMALYDYDPKLFTTKKTLHEFMKRYPALRTTDVV